MLLRNLAPFILTLGVTSLSSILIGMRGRWPAVLFILALSGVYLVHEQHSCAIGHCWLNGALPQIAFRHP